MFFVEITQKNRMILSFCQHFFKNLFMKNDYYKPFSLLLALFSNIVASKVITDTYRLRIATRFILVRKGLQSPSAGSWSFTKATNDAKTALLLNKY